MAVAIEVFMVLLTLSGLAYLLLALWAGRSYLHRWRSRPLQSGFAPTISILKPLKGVDPRMYTGFVSHCTQQYDGRYEILFGVSSTDDPAVAEIDRLRTEFPSLSIRLVICAERLGASGKISNLTQMLPHALGEIILVNDGDIVVSPHYLARITAAFGERTGMVTAPYIGNAGVRPSLWSKLEALGIATDFIPGVLTARMLEGGVRFGLGSTLAIRREALDQIGGFAPLADALADDYELGARIHAAGWQVELCPEVVETAVPHYTLSGFWDHQIRWARTTRDSRRLGYIGLSITYALPWAILTCIASGFALWSFTLLALVLLARVSVALSIGVGILRDGQTLRDLWLLPLRDTFALLFWAWSYAGDTITWRGEKFHLNRGTLTRA